MWPWLLMPLIVLLVFYALLRVHRSAPAPISPSPDTSVTGTPGR
ncbi:MAG TPA: hypothetical protein VLX08_00295 [Steroidobacteraceae bacterium]|nr:hypothetical protein [Steroidobacteraceae bacterium]